MWTIETKLLPTSDWVIPRVSIQSELIEDLEKFVEWNDFDRVYEEVRFVSSNGDVLCRSKTSM